MPRHPQNATVAFPPHGHDTRPIQQPGDDGQCHARHPGQQRTGHASFDNNPITFTNGVAIVSTTVSTAETVDLTASDTNGKTGVLSALLINPAPANGDYRTAASGDWNDNSTWQTFNGFIWVAASDTPTTQNVTVRNGHTVDVGRNVRVNEVTVQTGGTITSAQNLSLSGSGTALDIFGTVKARGLHTSENGTTDITTTNWALVAGTTTQVELGGSLAIDGGNLEVDGTLLVVGGTVTTASGDEISGNGTMTISGGTVTVGAPGQGNDFSVNTVNMTGGLLILGRGFGPNTESLTGGTIHFTATQTGFQIPQTTYANVILSGGGSGVMNLNLGNGDTVITGNLSITGTTVVSVRAPFTAHSLTLGGVRENAGTWGGPLSGADNINATYFAPATPGDYITVTSSPSPYYKSRATGDWSDFNTWSIANDGVNFVNATIGQTPTAANSDGILITGGFNVTVASSVSIDQTTVDAGNTITVNSSAALTVADGTGTDLNVSGTVVSAGTIIPAGTILFESTGKYQHNQNAGTIPASTWNAGSTCEYTGATSSAPAAGGLAQSFANFTWNCPGQSQAIDNSGNFDTANGCTISGNLTIQNSNGQEVRLGSIQTGTITVGGNLAVMSGGILSLSSGAGVRTINLSGNISVASGGTLMDSSTGGSINFAKAGMQTFTSGGTFTGGINWKINSGSTLDIGSSTVGGTGTFTVDNGGTLEGGGTIAGAMTVNSTGTVSPGVASIATITLDSAPSLSGTMAMDVDKTTGTTSADKIARNGSGLAYGGTLTITKTGADTLTSGDSFTLFTISAGSFSGWFSTVTLPTLTTGLSWDTNKLRATGILDVYTFTTNAFQTMSALSNTPATLLISKVLGKTTGGVGVLRWVSATGAANGTLTTNATAITYTSTGTFVGADSFSCVVSDTNATLTTVTVIVTVNAINAGPSLAGVDDGNGHYQITTSGMPNQNYNVQAITGGTGDWQLIPPVATAAANGVVIWTDPDPISAHTSRIYRLVQP